MSTTSKKTEATKQLQVNERKWSKTLMDAGWTVIPNVIIERQQALGLDSMDVNILMHLATYWWTADEKPHPSKKTIAKAIGVDPRTIQRRIAALENDGLIERKQRRFKGHGSKTNVYDLGGLIKEAIPYAQEKIQDRLEAEEQKRKKAGRKGKPNLRVIKRDEDLVD